MTRSTLTAPITIFRLLVVAGLLVLSGGVPGADDLPPKENPRAALAKTQDFIGKWRGVGQLRRGSNEGSWVERQEWVWKFGTDDADDSAGAALTFAAVDGKYLQSGELTADGETYSLSSTSPDGRQIVYAGKRDDGGKLTLTASDPPAGAPARITLKLTAGGDRLVTLYERKAPAGDAYVRLAEVGYTREGSGFGKGTSYVECIVTGGKGVIPVEHDGKKYFVCCSGCRDLFDQDPAAAIADYEQRKELEKAKDK